MRSLNSRKTSRRTSRHFFLLLHKSRSVRNASFTWASIMKMIEAQARVRSDQHEKIREAERKRIQMRRHIASTTGRLIFAPGAADIVTFFQHDKGAATHLFQCDTRVDSRKSGADDDDFKVDCRLELVMRASA
jgi:hypothetical protein